MLKDIYFHIKNFCFNFTTEFHVDAMVYWEFVRKECSLWHPCLSRRK